MQDDVKVVQHFTQIDGFRIDHSLELRYGESDRIYLLTSLLFLSCHLKSGTNESIPVSDKRDTATEGETNFTK